jgi:hypothetical protein
MAELEPSKHPGWPVGKHRAGPTASKRSGIYALRRALDELGSRGELLDESTAVGRELAKWKAALLEDLGGAERVSTQERALVDLVVRDRLLLESVDAWLLGQSKLVNGRRFAIIPALVQRMTIAEGYSRRLQVLGLRRRERPAPSLAEYLRAREAAAAPESQPEGEGQPPEIEGVS